MNWGLETFIWACIVAILTILMAVTVFVAWELAVTAAASADLGAPARLLSSMV